jgi:hypothetical protein
LIPPPYWSSRLSVRRAHERPGTRRVRSRPPTGFSQAPKRTSQRRNHAVSYPFVPTVTHPVFPNAQRGGLTQTFVRLDRDGTVVDALSLRAVQFLSTYPPCSIGISTPEGVVHIGPRIPPSSSGWGVVGKGAQVERGRCPMAAILGDRPRRTGQPCREHMPEPLEQCPTTRRLRRTLAVNEEALQRAEQSRRPT